MHTCIIVHKSTESLHYYLITTYLPYMHTRPLSVIYCTDATQIHIVAHIVQINMRTHSLTHSLTQICRRYASSSSDTGPRSGQVSRVMYINMVASGQVQSCVCMGKSMPMCECSCACTWQHAYVSRNLHVWNGMIRAWAGTNWGYILALHKICLHACVPCASFIWMWHIVETYNMYTWPCVPWWKDAVDIHPHGNQSRRARAYILCMEKKHICQRTT